MGSGTPTSRGHSYKHPFGSRQQPSRDHLICQHLNLGPPAYRTDREEPDFCSQEFCDSTKTPFSDPWTLGDATTPTQKTTATPHAISVRGLGRGTGLSTQTPHNLGGCHLPQTLPQAALQPEQRLPGPCLRPLHWDPQTASPRGPGSTGLSLRRLPSLTPTWHSQTQGAGSAHELQQGLSLSMATACPTETGRDSRLDETPPYVGVTGDIPTSQCHG